MAQVSFADPPPAEGYGEASLLDGPRSSRYVYGEPREITPFYRAFISFMQRKDLVHELERRKKLQDSMQILDPNSPLSTKLRTACFWAIIYNIFTVPLRSAFEIPDHVVFYVLDALMDIPLYVKLILNFLSPYQEEGQRDMVRSKLKITVAYLKGEFLLDFVSLLPLDYAFQDPWWRTIRLLLMKRLDRLQRHWEKTTKWNPMMYRMGKVICLVLLPILHFVACFWYFVARRYSNDISPVTPLPLDYITLNNMTQRGEHLQSLYVGIKYKNFTSVYERTAHHYGAALYFSAVYLVGYNAGIPRNVQQAVFSLIAVLLGASVFAIIIGYVGVILRDLDNTQQLFRDQVHKTNNFMRYSKIPDTTVKNVRHFYKHMWESRRALENLSVVKGLPKSLHRELQVYLHKEFVAKVDLFQGCDDLFLEEVSCCLQYVAVLPQYYIIRKGEVGKEMFFIKRGQVEVVSTPAEGEDPDVLAHLQEGTFFGEVALVVPGMRRTASIRSSTFTELFVLEKVHFEQLLSSYPETKQRILQVARQRGLIK